MAVRHVHDRKDTAGQNGRLARGSGDERGDDSVAAPSHFVVPMDHMAEIYKYLLTRPASEVYRLLRALDLAVPHNLTPDREEAEDVGSDLG